MAFVSVTRLRIRRLRFLPGFFVHAARTQRQAQHAAGFVGGALLADRRWTFWTMTLWSDQAAMRSYLTAGAHRAAMPKLIDWCDEASVAHWDQDEAALPGWAEADRRMRSEGRASKVRHPSAVHASLDYDPPRLSRTVPIAARR